MMEFIDTHCDVFTGDEENKFEHSTLHQAYVELSMSLIESFLHEIGISQEAFAAACDEGIKRGGSEAAVFSQIIAADDFLTFKRMMHARSASLDFQAHLQYEKIRNSAIPGATAAAMQSCGQHLVSRNHAEHQPTIEQHQLQHSGSFVSRSASDSPFRHSNPALQVDSKELQSGSDVEDDDERLLQQAIELSKLAFEEMRSQAQQEEDDIETAIRLSILEAEEQSKRLQMEQDALSSLSSPLVSASQTDTWQMELEAARQREQQALLSFAAAQQQAVGKMDIVHESSASSASAAIVSSVAATSLPTSQPLLDPRSSTLTRLGALPPISRGSRPVLDNSASHSLSIDCARPIPPPAPFCEISGSGFGSKMDPLELHKRKQHLESLRDQIRLREQQERRQALADNAIAPSSASVSDAQLQQRRELAERLRSL